MTRAALWILGTAMAAAAVHLVAILALPFFVPEPVAARLARLGPEFRFHALRPQTGEGGVNWLDPAFAYAVCRFSLASAPTRIRPRLPDVLWSLSLHEADLVAVYDVNDRGVDERGLDVVIAHADQVPALRDSPPADLRDPVVVTWSGADQGFALLRAFVPAPSARADVEAALADSRCEPVGR